MKQTKFISITAISLLFSAFAVTLSVATFKNGSNHLFATSPTIEWVHYSKVDASFSQTGIKEYWVSCSTHEHQFSAPTGDVHITDGGTPTRDFIDSLDTNDDRLIDVYTKTFDFDNNRNSLITIHDGFNSLQIVDGEGIGGSKALKASYTGGARTDSHLRIDKSYLDAIFADENVKSLSFYAKGTLTTNNFRHITVNQSYVNNNSSLISCYERNNTNYGINNLYKKFYLTREVYSQMNGSDWFIQYGGIGPYDLYLDNFSISRTNYFDYTANGLENGYFEKNNDTTYYLRDAASSQANFLITTGNAANVASFDYDNYTEGYRSIHISRTANAGINFYLRGDYAYANLPEEGIYVDFYTSANLNGWWDGQNDGAICDGNGVHFVKEVDESIKAGVWYTFHFTKSQINSGGGRFMLVQGSTLEDIYIDNIRLATREVESFESTTAFQVYAPSYDQNNAFGGASRNRIDNNENDIRTCVNNHNFIFLSEWKVCTGAEISDEYASDGFYSLKLTKTSNGTLRINPYYLDLFDDENVITFDVYTNNLNRLTATTKGGNTLKLTNGAWTTISLQKSDITTSGSSIGRFTENAFGAGDIYIDNIHVSQQALYSNGGVIHCVNNETAVINTSLTIDKLNSVSIDGDTATFVTGSGTSFELDASQFTAGQHEVIVTYFNNGKLICEHIAVEAMTLSANNAINLSIAYGNSGYYTLSGYSNIYRMMVDNYEFPFEISGSNYLLPNAALVELLPTVNNQKVSGTIKLKMFSISQNYVLPINITVSNSVNVKNIPSYNGNGISSHAYSSTNSQTTRDDYEQYENLNKIAEYQNTGLDMLYVQSAYVGLYEYTINDAMDYLLNNAEVYNQKVLMADAAFNLLAKYNTSLIGTDLLEQVDSAGNPTGSKYINSHIPTVNSNRRFSSTDELDDFVEYRLRLYIDYPACVGVNTGDEQSYLMLNGGYKDLMASLHRVLTKLGRTDFYLNSNLQPLTATDLTLTGIEPGGNVSEAQHEQNYIGYLDAYVANSGNDYIQFDAYPFASSDKGGNYEGQGLNKWYIKNLLIVAEYCKEHDLDLYMVTQSVTYYGTRILNRRDIAWINNMVMGMGVKHVSYFVYCVRKNTGNETWIDGSAFLSIDGTRTDLYYYYQSAIHEINQFAPVVSCFDYKWLHLYRAYSYSTATIYTNVANSVYYSNTTSYAELQSVSTSAEWTLVTALQNSSDSKYMYMVQNVYNHFDNSRLQTVTLTFTSSHEYAVVYESGLPRVVIMNSSSLQLKLSEGRAAFVMVF